MADPKTLDEAYERYKTGKGFGRQDLFGFMIGEIKSLQARIGAVDEAKVQELTDRVAALEKIIGNALRSAPAIETDVTGRPNVTTTTLTAPKKPKVREPA